MATKRTKKPMTPAQREAFYEKKNAEANQAMTERDEAIAREFGAVLDRLLNGEHDVVFRTPWMTQMCGGHSFGFDAKGDAFKNNPLGGELNNILLAIQAWKREMTDKDYRPDLGMLVATGGFLKNIKSEVRIFEGIKAHTSLFRPNLRSFWVMPDGSIWKCPADGRKWQSPTKTEKENLGLKKRSTLNKKMPFSVYKVFSIADVYDRLPEDAKGYVDQVVHERQGVGMQVDTTDDFHADIMNTMKAMAQAQGIKVNEGGNGAYYNFVKDEITIPTSEGLVNKDGSNGSAFTSMVEFASTLAHELAHSTMHLNNRKISPRGDVLGYSIEELIAEMTAQVVISKLHAKYKPMIEAGRSDIEAEFQDYYANSTAYLKHYSRDETIQSSFLDCVQTVVSEQAQAQNENKNENAKLFTDIMGSVFKAVNQLWEGECTPELRKEALLKNLKANDMEKFLPTSVKESPESEPEAPDERAALEANQPVLEDAPLAKPDAQGFAEGLRVESASFEKEM